jgi:hypothetical protein
MVIMLANSWCGVSTNKVLLPVGLILTGASFSIPEVRGLPTVYLKCKILNLVTLEWRYLDIGFYLFLLLDCMYRREGPTRLETWAEVTEERDSEFVSYFSVILAIAVMVLFGKTHVLHKKFLLFSFLCALVAAGLWAPEGFFHKYVP